MLKNIFLYGTIFIAVFAAALYFKIDSGETFTQNEQAGQETGLQDKQTVNDIQQRAADSVIDTNNTGARSGEPTDTASTEDDSTAIDATDYSNLPDASRDTPINANDQQEYARILRPGGPSEADLSSTNPLVDNTTPGRKFGTVSPGTVETPEINKYYKGRSGAVNPWALQEFYGTSSGQASDQGISKEFETRHDNLKKSIDKLRQQQKNK